MWKEKQEGIRRRKAFFHLLKPSAPAPRIDFLFRLNLFFVFSSFNIRGITLTFGNRRKRIPVVQQFYQTRVIDEFVLHGNAGILKCNLPSFVADFVHVESWISDDGTEIFPNNDDFGIRKNVVECVILIWREGGCPSPEHERFRLGETQT